jgi:fatty acid desaturase
VVSQNPEITYGNKPSIQTALVALLLISIFASTFVLYEVFDIPALVFTAVNTIVFYYVYVAIHHEATHGNISGGKPNKSPIDRFFGELAGWLIDLNFVSYSKIHILHHEHTNQRRDTLQTRELNSAIGTFAVSGRAIATKLIMAIPIKRVQKTLLLNLTGKKNKVIALLLKKSEPMIYTQNRISICLVLASMFTDYWDEVLFLWYIPANLYIFLSVLLHDWLPHFVTDDSGARETSKYKNTKMLKWPGSHIMMCGHDYHLVHHLYTKIPYHKYKKAYSLIEDELAANGAIVRTIR